MNLKNHIREFADFPIPGIGFKDITPLLKSAEIMQYIFEQFAQRFRNDSFDLVAGTESRGLIFASAFALYMGKGFIMARKKGKLPGPTTQVEYGLEYGDGILEMQRDALEAGQRVLIVDDLLATGGTARAAGDLVEKLGGKVSGYAFVIELAFLSGRKAIGDYDIESLVVYNE